MKKYFFSHPYIDYQYFTIFFLSFLSALVKHMPHTSIFAVRFKINNRKLYIREYIKLSYGISEAPSCGA